MRRMNAPTAAAKEETRSTAVPLRPWFLFLLLSVTLCILRSAVLDVPATSVFLFSHAPSALTPCVEAFHAASPSDIPSCKIPREAWPFFRTDVLPSSSTSFLEAKEEREGGGVAERWFVAIARIVGSRLDYVINTVGLLLSWILRCAMTAVLWTAATIRWLWVDWPSAKTLIASRFASCFRFRTSAPVFKREPLLFPGGGPGAGLIRLLGADTEMSAYSRKSAFLWVLFACEGRAVHLDSVVGAAWSLVIASASSGWASLLYKQSRTWRILCGPIAAVVWWRAWRLRTHGCLRLGGALAGIPFGLAIRASEEWGRDFASPIFTPLVLSVVELSPLCLFQIIQSEKRLQVTAAVTVFMAVTVLTRRGVVLSHTVGWSAGGEQHEKKKIVDLEEQTTEEDLYLERLARLCFRQSRPVKRKEKVPVSIRRVSFSSLEEKPLLHEWQECENLIVRLEGDEEEGTLYRLQTVPAEEPFIEKEKDLSSLNCFVTIGACLVLLMWPQFLVYTDQANRILEWWTLILVATSVLGCWLDQLGMEAAAMLRCWLLATGAAIMEIHVPLAVGFGLLGASGLGHGAGVANFKNLIILPAIHTAVVIPAVMILHQIAFSETPDTVAELMAGTLLNEFVTERIFRQLNRWVALMGVAILSVNVVARM